VRIDDLKVQSFGTLRPVAETIPDTTCYVFNLSRDTVGYCYFVTAVDTFGNVSMASQYHDVAVGRWAEPYTRPAPFGGEPPGGGCELVLDFPAGETPDVVVYTLSGAPVRKWKNETRRVIPWDGKNQQGRELADGLYLVVVQGRNFRKLGKIARVSR
jgi:hypothetical protein